MPAGIEFDAVQSYAAMAGVKFVGYSLAGLYLNRLCQEVKHNFLVVGAGRTLLGILFGICVGIVGFWALDLAIYIFLLALIPVRLLEWWITIRVFYGQDAINVPRYIALGTVWSFVLDIPAVMGFIATGGLWIC